MEPGLRSKATLAATLAVVFVVADQVTKAIAVRSFSPPVQVIPGFFQLISHGNQGAAWGLLGGLPDGVRVPFFIVVSVLATGVVAYLIYKASPEEKLYVAALGMVLGGAVGNLIDRLRQGYVVDFLDFNLQFYDYPVFNVADIGITVGVALLLLDQFVLQRRRRVVAEAGKKQRQ